MTTNSKCHICSKKLTIKNATLDTSTIDRMCNKCYDESGLENEHQDGHHEDEPNAACPMCNDTLASDLLIEHTAPEIVHTEHINHTACYVKDLHEKSRQGRQDCRDQGMWRA